MKEVPSVIWLVAVAAVMVALDVYTSGDRQSRTRARVRNVSNAIGAVVVLVVLASGLTYLGVDAVSAARRVTAGDPTVEMDQPGQHLGVAGILASAARGIGTLLWWNLKGFGAALGRILAVLMNLLGILLALALAIGPSALLLLFAQGYRRWNRESQDPRSGEIPIPPSLRIVGFFLYLFVLYLSLCWASFVSSAWLPDIYWPSTAPGDRGGW